MWKALESKDTSGLINESEELELGPSGEGEENSDLEDRQNNNEKSEGNNNRTIGIQYLNLHGIRYCFNNKIHRRILWIIILLLSISTCLYFLSTSIKIYLTHPFYTVSTIKRTDKLEFPAITICNINPVRFSIMNGTKLHRWISELTRRRGTRRRRMNSTRGHTMNSTREHKMNSTRVRIRGYKMNSTRGRTRGYKMNSTRGYRMNRTRHDYNSFVDTLLNATHRIEDMLYSCLFGYYQTCKPSDFTNDLYYDYGTACYTLNSGVPGKMRFPATTGTTSLKMTVNIDYPDYYLVTKHVGIYLTLHGVDERPSAKKKLLISPGLFTHVAIRKQQIKNLPPPYTNCGTKKLKYFAKYTVEHCYMDLLTDVVATRCGCRSFEMPGNGTLCERKAFSRFCLYRQWSKFYDNYKEKSPCPTPCNFDTYSTTLSYALFPSNIVADKMAASLNRTNGTVQENRQFIRENYLKLKISYSDLSYDVTEQVPLYNVENLLGTIGGLMALFIGASILTFVELADCIFGALFFKYKRK